VADSCKFHFTLILRLVRNFAFEPVVDGEAVAGVDS
jgi:hypothetical protein